MDSEELQKGKMRVPVRTGRASRAELYALFFVYVLYCS